MKHNDTDRKVEETLAILDAPLKVKANPFFYTRLKVKMDSQQMEHRLRDLIPARLIIMALGFLLLILINAYSVLNLSYRTNESVKSQELESFAETYNFTKSNL
jgi:hypothetical protein